MRSTLLRGYALVGLVGLLGLTACVALDEPAAGGPGGKLDDLTSCAAEERASCVHSFGGVYADGGCSRGFQCCDGTWAQKESCGACSCVEETGEAGCSTCEEAPPRTGTFEASIAVLDAARRARMTGVSWRTGCPVALDDLRLVTLTHWGFDGEVHVGELVVARAAARDVIAAMGALFDAGFPIGSMRPVEDFDGDDDRSMAANNTSAFNCRAVTGGSGFSTHSFGTSIDLNPVQNPFVSGATVLPPAGRGFLDRAAPAQGMILAGGPVVAAFRAIGWEWGGAYSSRKDYQHFSADGR